MTGAFLRVKRGEKWVNVEVEYLSDKEREMLKDDPRLLQWLNLICNTLAEFEARWINDSTLTENFHASLASVLFHVPYKNVTKAMREDVKKIIQLYNYGARRR